MIILYCCCNIRIKYDHNHVGISPRDSTMGGPLWPQWIPQWAYLWRSPSLVFHNGGIWKCYTGVRSQGPRFFYFDIQNFRNVTATRLRHPPLWAILDLLLGGEWQVATKIIEWIVLQFSKPSANDSNSRNTCSWGMQTFMNGYREVHIVGETSLSIRVA